MTSKRRILLALPLVALLLAAVAWVAIPYPHQNVDADYAVPPGTPAQTAAWADDVYVGTVVKDRGVKYRDGEPFTVFRVKVLKTLKGQVAGNIKVAQEGGKDPVRRIDIEIGNTPLLEVGKTYVLATRVSSSGWHTSPSGNEPVPVQAVSDPSVAKWIKAVASPQKQKNVYSSEVQKSQNPQKLYEEAAD